MDYKKLQRQYNEIYAHFKTTTEPFDLLEWDGRMLNVWNKNKLIEKYSLNDLKNANINL
ncbi:hypothetical protein KKA15_03335 [Patescibacteria group bacterium]|nr:hypothetical protein [Patescibacteria group bacterium]